MVLRKVAVLNRIGLCVVFLLCMSGLPSHAQQEITNDSVVQMAKAGLGDSLIIQSINATPSKFAMSANDIITLKQAGVSERVIGAMIAKDSAPPQSTMPPTDPRMPLNSGDQPTRDPLASGPAAISLEGVEEPGVYYKARDGKWVFIEPELMNFRSGGALKSYSTNHIIKEDKNGHLIGPTSALALSKSTPILIYMPAGASAIEYLLLRFRPGAQNSREFRSETGGVFHSTSGAMRDRVLFNPLRINSRMYEFTLPDEAGKGEYGILPPFQDGNAGQGGKIFTFKIVE